MKSEEEEGGRRGRGKKRGSPWLKLIKKTNEPRPIWYPDITS